MLKLIIIVLLLIQSPVSASPKLLRFHISNKCQFREEIKSGVKQLNSRSDKYRFIHRKRRSIKVHCNKDMRPLGLAIPKKKKVLLAARATTSPQKATHVTIHEIFHVLGIKHNNIQGSIMNPKYYGYTTILDRDIKELEQIINKK